MNIINKLLEGAKVRQLLALHNAGGILEEPTTSIPSLEAFADGNSDTAELIEASKAAILARRHLEETIQRLSTKYAR